MRVVKVENYADSLYIDPSSAEDIEELAQLLRDLNPEEELKLTTYNVDRDEYNSLPEAHMSELEW